ncbi:alpha/beta hydrolase fold [Streptoalloteichus tenebrarius]|uniref:Alpha/beta hydrolase fold n=2 Tax=Actinomycetes TaxID=1760 RepID=A0ABT1I2C6_STRSD|nr:alpha/beta hydrolase [Streptoalloteichus tenebrarius]MCP2261931.1 alpha/beta hydrolase fold [Streptoalloteichus tenebrarius]
MRRLLLAATGVVATASALLTTAPSATAAPDATPGVPDRYLHQQITWKPCFPDRLPDGASPGSERLECGSFSAPRNWGRPDEKVDIVVAVSRLRPAKGEPRGSVLTNPGGPGGPGRTLPLVFLQQNRAKLLDNMEIVGIDPRGTGESSNVSCGGGSEIGAGLDPRDRSQGNIDLMLDSAALAAKFCQTKSGELGRYVTTEQTVKDLDLLRHLLGREKVSYVGYSGGSWMGAYYATYFPNRVDKFVLDSNTEFTTTWQKSFAWQPKGFERRFREDFLPWVARYDGVYHLGTTGEAVRQTYERVRAKLAEQPVDLGQGTTMSAPLLDDTLASGIYGKTAFPDLADALAQLNTLVERPATEQARAAAAAVRQALPRLTRAALPGVLPVSADAFPATFYNITCNDTPTTATRQSLIRDTERSGRKYPLIGWRKISDVCAFWKRPDVHMPTPDGKGVPPVLMVQSVNDPATPMEGAKRAHEAFANSRMLTVTAEGDHGIYSAGNACVDEVVEKYLVDGVVPERDLSCAGTPLPEPKQAGAREKRSVAPEAANPLLLHAQLRDLIGPMPR